MMSHSHLSIMFVHLIQAADAGGLVGAALPLLVMGVIAGLYVALRIMAVLSVIARALAREAVTIGMSVFVIVIFSSLIGISLSR